MSLSFYRQHGTITKSIDHINHLQYNNTYDSTDRLTASTITDASTQQRKAMFEYNFDLNNNMSEFTTLTPKGHNKVQYTYGKDNLLTGMTLDNQGTLDFIYNGIGLPTDHTVNLTNPLTTTYTYHEITSEGTAYKNNLIRTEKIGNGDFWYLYHYDANNNINRLYQNAEIEANKVLLVDYSYDDLGQLTLVNYYLRNKRYKYDYDNGGNITEERVYDTSGSDEVLSATNTYTYDNTWKDLLIRYNGDTITYDEIGNPLSYRDGISFTWSNGRQLHSYTKNNNTITYTYDNNGMRLSKDVGNTHYSYLYQNGLLVQETIGDKVLDYSYTSGGQIVSVRYKTNANDSGVYYYYALNSRGDVVGLYDENGALYAKYTYDVWGNPISVKNASGANLPSDDIANIQSLRYRGYYYDSDTGFYYLQSRYYDPVTHRFINADGLVSTGTGVLGYNMFAYCENNPINCTDANGERGYPSDFIGPIQEGDYWLYKDGHKKYQKSHKSSKANTSNQSYSHSTQTYRDVTVEVDDAIKPYLQYLSIYNKLINFCIQEDVSKKVYKYYIFIPLVYRECTWDIKLQESWEKTIKTPFPGDETTVKYHEEYMTPECLGNYTYGMLGKSLGLSLPELYAGSYVAAGFPYSGVKLANETYDWTYIRKGYYY